MPRHTKTHPRRVDFIEHEQDMEVLLLGELGFSTQFIVEQTKLSPCQVGYRLWKGEVRRKDYRNGQSLLATEIIKSPWARDVAMGHAKEKLKC